MILSNDAPKNKPAVPPIDTVTIIKLFTNAKCT